MQVELLVADVDRLVVDVDGCHVDFLSLPVRALRLRHRTAPCSWPAACANRCCRRARPCDRRPSAVSDSRGSVSADERILAICASQAITRCRHDSSALLVLGCVVQIDKQFLGSSVGWAGVVRTTPGTPCRSAGESISDMVRSMAGMFLRMPPSMAGFREPACELATSRRLARMPADQHPSIAAIVCSSRMSSSLRLRFLSERRPAAAPLRFCAAADVLLELAAELARSRSSPASRRRRPGRRSSCRA